MEFRKSGIPALLLYAIGYFPTKIRKVPRCLAETAVIGQIGLFSVILDDFELGRPQRSA